MQCSLIFFIIKSFFKNLHFHCCFLFFLLQRPLERRLIVRLTGYCSWCQLLTREMGQLVASAEDTRRSSIESLTSSLYGRWRVRIPSYFIFSKDWMYYTPCLLLVLTNKCMFHLKTLTYAIFFCMYTYIVYIYFIIFNFS